MRPNYRIRCLREHREEGRKILPILQLFRKQGAVKSQVPVITRHLRDGDVRLRTIGKQNRKLRSQRRISRPPIPPKTNRSTIAHDKLNMFQKNRSDFDKVLPELRPTSSRSKQG